MTAEIGDMIFQFCRQKPQAAPRCLALAQHVYISIGFHGPAVVCMAHQGRVQQALQHAHQKANFTPEDYLTLFQVPLMPIEYYPPPPVQFFVTRRL